VGCPFESGHGANPPVTRDTASVGGGDQPTPQPKKSRIYITAEQAAAWRAALNDA